MYKNIVIAILAAPWTLFLYKMARGQVSFTREAVPVGVDETDGPAFSWRMSEELDSILNRNRAD